jgi:hypothetical protein
MERSRKGVLMNMHSQRFTPVLVLTFMALLLMGCGTPYTTLSSGISSTQSLSTPTPAQAFPPQVIIESPNPAYANAQATIDTGKSQLMDLSRKETQTSLNMSQAANAAAQATNDFNQRQKSDLNFQATVVSQNITQAAATQKFILQQTKIAQDATTAAQSSAATAAQSLYLMNVNQTEQAQAILNAQVLQTDQAAATLTAYSLTATYSAYLLNATGTVQAQAILNAQATQTAQAIAALKSYPSTATSAAATQAALLMQEYGREQQTFVNRIVVPLIPILITLDLLAFILVVILAYRRSITIPWPRRLRLASGNVHPNPLLMIDGVISDPDPSLQPPIPAELPPANPPRRPDENTVHVEIVNATEPPVAQWIAEVEHQMTVEGGV